MNQINKISIFIFFVVLLSGIGLWSCHKDCGTECGVTDEEYIVFGHFYGYCVGEGCIEMYKIEDSRVYEDTKDQYPGRDDFYQGHFNTTLSDEKFQLENRE